MMCSDKIYGILNIMYNCTKVYLRRFSSSTYSFEGKIVVRKILC